jgi:hypothetical protein
VSGYHSSKRSSTILGNTLGYDLGKVLSSNSGKESGTVSDKDLGTCLDKDSGKEAGQDKMCKTRRFLRFGSIRVEDLKESEPRRISR